MLLNFVNCLSEIRHTNVQHALDKNRVVTLKMG